MRLIAQADPVSECAPGQSDRYMNKTGFSPKTKRLLTCIAFALILGMFAVRGLLLQNGTIDEIMTLSPDELTGKISKVQMKVSSGSKSGMGTAIDSFKSSVNEETFSTYMITANHCIEDPADITVEAFDGTTYEASLVATDVDRDLAIILIHTEDEIEASYSRDAISRASVEDTVYYYSVTGELVAGTLASKNVTVSGLEITTQYGEAVPGTETLKDLYTVTGDLENGMSGGGVYDVTGYYMGMIVQGSEEGTLVVIPGNEVHDAVKAAS